MVPMGAVTTIVAINSCANVMKLMTLRPRFDAIAYIAPSVEPSFMAVHSEKCEPPGPYAPSC